MPKNAANIQGFGSPEIILSLILTWDLSGLKAQEASLK